MKTTSLARISRLAVLPMLALFGWFQGCSGTFTWPEHLKPLWNAAASDTLRLGYMFDPGSHLPLLEAAQESAVVNDLIHRAPLRRQADGTYTGDLWKEWNCLEQDGKLIVEGTWDRAVWHDGVPFTVDDFDFTLATMKATETRSPFVALAADIAAIEHTADRAKTKMVFPRNSRRYLDLLCVSLVPKHLLSNHSPVDPVWSPATGTTLVWNEIPAASQSVKMPRYSFKQWPCGLGRYRITDLRSGYYLHLELMPPVAAEHSAGETSSPTASPAYRQVLVRYYYSPEDLVTDMRSLALDWAIVPSEFAARLEELRIPGWVYQRRENPSYTMLGFQTATSPWNLRDVREAVDHAIDRKEIVTLMAAEGITAGVPPLMPDISRVGLEMRTFDVAKARDLLERAGVRDTNGDGVREWQGKPLNMNILVNGDNLLRKMLAEALVPMLKRVGLQAQIEAVDWSEMVEKRLAVGSFSTFVMGFYAPTDGNWINLWHSNPPTGEKLNFTGFSDKELDGVLEDMDKAVPLERPASGPEKIARILYQQVPGVFLFCPRDVTILRQGLPTGTPDRDWLANVASATVKR